MSPARIVTAGEARIPALGLGTFGLDDAAAERTVAEAIRLGYRHVDTARIYGNEAGVGRGLRAGLAAAGLSRDDVLLVTKIWPSDFAGRDFLRAADAALRTLDVDWVNLLLLHWPSPSVPLGETLEALGRVVAAGKARFGGVSNFTRSLFRQAVTESPVPIVANQVEYHPYLDQEPLRTLVREHGAALTAYSPLAKGTAARDPVLSTVGRAHGATAGQVALAWLLSKEGVVVIPKTGSAERLRENAAALDLRLSADELATIDGLARPGGRMVEMPGVTPEWD